MMTKFGVGAMVCLGLLMACATGNKEVREPAGNPIKGAWHKVKGIFVHDHSATDSQKFRAEQYGDITTLDTKSPDAVNPPPPMEAPPPPPGALPGPVEQIIPMQIARVKSGQSFFERDRQHF